MTGRWRVAVFDIVSPLTSAAAFVTIGVALGWPVWWVSVCTVLCLLVVQTMGANFYVLRREGTSVGTDPHAPGLRLAAVGMTAASALAAVFVGYTHWVVPNSLRATETGAVVRTATTVAEATATFSPQDPTSAIARASELVDPEKAGEFTEIFDRTATDLTRGGVSTNSTTLSAGVEVISSTAASVAVIMRTVRRGPGDQTESAVQALRVTLTKHDNAWRVLDVEPIDPSTKGHSTDEEG
jgi:hypothetical protein